MGHNNYSLLDVVSSFSLLFLVTNVQASVFDVTKYGARPNPKRDISQFLLAAFKDACASPTPSKIFIPKGKYALSRVVLAGPCKAPIEFQLQGTLLASQDTSRFKGFDNWVNFQYMENFSLYGGGTFDGQGSSAWTVNNCKKKLTCGKLPISIRFDFITNGLVKDITSLDSKNFHINVLGCKNITFSHMKIIAPEESPNTDGIHTGRSDGIVIEDVIIKTGDDCISIGDGTKNMKISKVSCGPGHGISIGSLGQRIQEQPVDDIRVWNCTIKGTNNGVRIKSWPSAPGRTTVSNVHFEDIIMDNVGFPILIDQEYCPHNLCNRKEPSKVKITNASFKNIRGTSATQVVAKLACSGGVPCEGVELGNIDLTYKGRFDGPSMFKCDNVKPKITGKQIPAACSTPMINKTLDSS